MRRRALLATTTLAPVQLPRAARAAAPLRPASVPGLVELFTSQGCSSCPPADEALATLADREGVIALGFHVTYWDRLGWRDTFGSERFTARQRAYAAILGTGQVYTPQAVVQGEIDLVGSDTRLSALVERVRERAETEPIDVIAGGEARLPELGRPVDAALWAAGYEAAVTVRIGRGENAGRTITYPSVVRELVDLGRWDGRWRGLRLPESLAGDRPDVSGGVVVVAQDPRQGTVLALGRRRWGGTPPG